MPFIADFKAIPLNLETSYFIGLLHFIIIENVRPLCLQIYFLLNSLSLFLLDSYCTYVSPFTNAPGELRLYYFVFQFVYSMSFRLQNFYSYNFIFAVFFWYFSAVRPI